MENKLPKFLMYDLEGYRGCFVTKFPLSFKVINGKIIGSYSNDDVEYGLATEIGDTKEEVVDKLLKTLEIERKYNRKLIYPKHWNNK